MGQIALIVNLHGGSLDTCLKELQSLKKINRKIQFKTKIIPQTAAPSRTPSITKIIAARQRYANKLYLQGNIRISTYPPDRTSRTS